MGKRFPSRSSGPPPTQQEQKPAAKPAFQGKGKTDSAFERVGAAFCNVTKTGKECIRVRMDDGTEFTLWPNTKKDKETSPDFYVTIKKD